MKVWLAGSKGMLARAVRERLQEASIESVETDLELNITDADAVRAHLASGQFTHIVNCAAYTRVDDAEKDEATAQRVNADGPGILADAAAQTGVSLVHFSTDYVFDGKGQRPYLETDPCNPQGAYARTKLSGEQKVMASLASDGKRGVYIIRTSWLFGEGGNNFVQTMLRLMTINEELRVVHDQVGRPTYTADLAQAALTLAGILGHNGPCAAGIYHFANAGAISWFEFTKGIFAAAQQLGLPIKTSQITPVTTAEFPRPAPRPAYSVLSTDRYQSATGMVPRNWTAALGDYLQNVRQGI